MSSDPWEEDVPPPEAPMTERPPGRVEYMWYWRESYPCCRGWPQHGLLTETHRQAVLDRLALGVRVAGALAHEQALRRPPDDFEEVLGRITHKFITPDPNRPPPLRLVHGATCSRRPA